MKSKITGGGTKFLFKKKILNKYDVDYYQCIETGFIQTEDPYWLGEAYSSAITKLDIGLPYRNQLQSNLLSKLINKYFDNEKEYLDYAGGYGLFTRLMRDKGFNFFHSDIYCDNIFAEFFEADLNNLNKKFELITALEVFEHMNNPLKEIEKLFSYSDSILFSTELHSEKNIPIENWWYFSFETGQHIAMFNLQTLEYLANKYGCNFYSDGSTTHLFTFKKFASNPFNIVREPFLIRKARKILRKFDNQKMPNSLLESDFNYIKNEILSK